MVDGINGDTATNISRRHSRKGLTDSPNATSSSNGGSTISYQKLVQGGIRIDKRLCRRANNLHQALGLLKPEQVLYLVIKGRRRARSPEVLVVSIENTAAWKRTRNLTPGSDFELYAYPAVID